jgi:hypothetical protein
MALDDKHPAYTDRLLDWELLSHCYSGERIVKEQAQKYLPPTSGMIANGFGNANAISNRGVNIGQAAYDAYRVRAVFHDFVRETIAGLIGVIHRKLPEIIVPPQLEPLLESATIQGESIRMLWRRITEAQLLHGRCGLLVDVPDGQAIGEAMPYVAVYSAPTIINWDVGQREQGLQEIELVILDESANERQADLSWTWQKQVRILSLSNIVRDLGATDQAAEGEGEYVVAVIRYGNEGDDAAATQLAAANWISPSIGAQKLDRVPFVFVNANDVTAEPEVPPFLGLANLSMAVYRGEADYRQSLFMQGQDTIVRIGATDEQQAMMTGVGSIIDLPIGGDAKYIGVHSTGLGEQRAALENDKAQALQTAVRSLDMRGNQAESGEALRVRVSAKTATLASLQLTAATAIKDVLTIAGRWLGISDAELEKIEVKPNLDFSDAKIDAVSVNALMDAVVKGAPLSLESIHNWLRENEYTTETWEDEQEKMRAEMTDGLRPDPVAIAEAEAAAAANPFGEEDAAEGEDGEPVEGEDGPPPKGKKPPPFARKG